MLKSIYVQRNKCCKNADRSFTCEIACEKKLLITSNCYSTFCLYISLQWKYSFHAPMTLILVCTPAHISINHKTFKKLGTNDVKTSMLYLFYPLYSIFWLFSPHRNWKFTEWLMQDKIHLILRNHLWNNKLKLKNGKSEKNSSFWMSVAFRCSTRFCDVWCVWFCTGPFAMVPLNMNCLQPFFCTSVQFIFDH